jgi:predicted branched-subunit amino acid permease
MEFDRTKWFLKGMRHGTPIALGYLAVAFTLGIAAKNAGLTPFQAMIASLSTNASAGEFAGFTLMAANAGYWELALMTLVVNARYLLMSCALSQKIHPDTPLRHRLLLGYQLSDEIFALAVTVYGYLCPYYNYGMTALAAPAWALGTWLGVLLGNILPASLVSALSVGLYGMFIAIIIPPSRKNKIIALLVSVSMVLSFALSRIPLFAGLSSGMRIIILTVLIAGAAAVLFPVKEEDHAA